MKVGKVNLEFSEKSTCCFTGHRLFKLPYGSDESCAKCVLLKNKLKEEIITLIERFGVTHYLSGMALGTDIFAAEIILRLQKDYPNLTLECALPCGSQPDKWNQAQKEKYFCILKRCSKITLLQPLYTDDCMRKRDEYMVNQSDFVIGVWNGSPSGTANTIAFATQENRIH